MKHPNPNPVTHYPITSHYYLSLLRLASLFFQVSITSQRLKLLHLSSFNHHSKTQTLKAYAFFRPTTTPSVAAPAPSPHRPRCSTPTLITSSLLNADAHHHLAAQRQRRTSPPPPLTTTHHHLAVTQIQTSSQSKRCVSCFDLQICNVLLVFFVLI